MLIWIALVGGLLLAILMMGLFIPFALSAAHASEQCIASWYSTRSSGSRTASGERLHDSALTAAHKHLRFGARVRVTNKRNGRSVTVRINDRGPYIRGRCIDLTHAGARAIGMGGIAPVRIEVIE